MDLNLLEVWRGGNRRQTKRKRARGQSEMIRAYARAVSVGASAQAGLMTLRQIERTMLATFAIEESIERGGALVDLSRP